MLNSWYELNIHHIYQNIVGKKGLLLQLSNDLEVNLLNIAYIGDDENDFECMQICGVKGCPNDSVQKIKNIADYVCQTNGGNGAVREFIDWLTNNY
ncbi:MAG: HAD hydrolase family protein [Oscillospiraceae bacterium]